MEKKSNKNAHLLQQDSKVEFAKFICNQDNGLSYPNMTECERYGMTWGCDKDCPVFQRKECELQEENNKQFGGALSERK